MSHFVAYADVLGFRDLVLDNRIPQQSTLDHKRRAGWWWHGGVTDLVNPLQQLFTAFHSSFDHAIDLTPWKTTATLLVFSDSLFLASDDADGCMMFCERFARLCINADVPVRIGVGFGTFVSHSFSFESTPRINIVSTQFLGSAVIHAVDAEKALKGTRIALHPSAAEALRAKAEDVKLIELGQLESCAAASHEWSLLSSGSEMGGMSDPDFVDQEGKLMAHLQTMMRRSPDKEHVHYLQTIAALERMVKLRDGWIPDEDDWMPGR